MARTRIRTVATVLVGALLIVCVAGAAFLAARTYRMDRRDAAIIHTPSTSASAAPTPSAVLSATAAPSQVTAVAPGSVPVAAKVRALLGPALSAAALGPTVHALVTDATTATVLLDRSGALATAPASTAKLTTATAVLGSLPSTARISTRVVAGAHPGQIVLVGGGDPTLSAAPAGTSSLYAGAARLSELARQVKVAVGAAPVTSIVVDTSLYTGPPEAPGWAQEDVPSDYASAITSLVVDGGRPATGGDIRSENPDLEAGRALATLLGAPAAPVSRGPAAAGARQLGVVRSEPMLDLVEQMLGTSDNVIAEMLARQVALKVGQPVSFAGAVTAVRSVLKSVGIVVPATLVDGSGLSGADRLSPSVLVALLRAALTGAQPALAQLISALPVAGWDGTLVMRYQVPPSAAAAGDVRAKTGTLTGVVTLAGIVRDSTGRLLVFAVMADAVPVGGTEAAEAALDAAISRLAACGCR